MIIKQSSQIPNGAPPLPVHAQVYQQLREQILFGELAPGQSVTLQGIVDHLGAGMTPVREAIRRLIAEGALVFQGNRRISVPVLDIDDVDQLIFARKTIESELAARAATRIEAAAIQTLARLDSQLDGAISAGDVVGYLAQNYQFHTALYEQAAAPILTEVADRLWLRFGPSLRVVCGRLGTQNLPDWHKDILAALENGDSDAAARAMALDVEQGMSQVRLVLATDSESLRFD